MLGKICLYPFSENRWHVDDALSDECHGRTGDLACENGAGKSFSRVLQKVRFYSRSDDQPTAFFEPHGFGRFDVESLERISEFLEIRLGRNRNFIGIDLGHQNKSKSGTKAIGP